MQTMVNSFTGIKAAYKALDDKMGLDITILDIREISIISDFFVIASGNSENHLKAMADEVEQQLYNVGFKLNHSEGFQSKTWILLDFGDIVVHLFNKEERDFYNIERIWGDAKFIDLEKLK